MKHLSIDDLKKALQDATMDTVFIDVRSKQEYEKEHIQGFVSIPFEHLEEHLDEFENKKVILSCFFGMRSQKAAMLLSEKVPSAEVVCLQGSLKLWEEKGNDIVGEPTIPGFSLEQQMFLVLAIVVFLGVVLPFGDFLLLALVAALLFASFSGKCSSKILLKKMMWNQK